MEEALRARNDIEHVDLAMPQIKCEFKTIGILFKANLLICYIRRFAFSFRLVANIVAVILYNTTGLTGAQKRSNPYFGHTTSSPLHDPDSPPMLQRIE